VGQALATEAIAECVIQPAKKRELRQHWQPACKLILANAEVLAVSRASSRSPTRRETRKEEVSDVRKNLKTPDS
jgi:alpha-ketoglutarate-dependent taurine dioxygenase